MGKEYRTPYVTGKVVTNCGLNLPKHRGPTKNRGSNKYTTIEPEVFCPRGLLVGHSRVRAHDGLVRPLDLCVHQSSTRIPKRIPNSLWLYLCNDFN